VLTPAEVLQQLLHQTLAVLQQQEQLQLSDGGAMSLLR
jgi:hypothetical protein